MRAPEFWRQDGALAQLLAPAACAYAAGDRWRRGRITPQRVPLPVLCVGNLVVGGAGKTPVALALGAMARASGIDAWFLTRGYGGRIAGPHRVDLKRDDAATVGDEALLLATRAPTVVAHDRPAGARFAASHGAALVIMDDGLQNPSLAKDLSLLVVDAGYGFGNGRVIPAGPLRETVAEGLARADAVIWLLGDEPARPLPDLAGKPLVSARVVPVPEAARFTGKPVFAFAGIGRPEKFFSTLRNLGARLVGIAAFPDHHRYSEDEVMALIEKAVALDAMAVTTAKDAVRLPPAARRMVEVLEVAVEFAEPAAALALLTQLRG